MKGAVLKVQQGPGTAVPAFGSEGAGEAKATQAGDSALSTPASLHSVTLEVKLQSTKPPQKDPSPRFARWAAWGPGADGRPSPPPARPAFSPQVHGQRPRSQPLSPGRCDPSQAHMTCDSGQGGGQQEEGRNRPRARDSTLRAQDRGRVASRRPFCVLVTLCSSPQLCTVSITPQRTASGPLLSASLRPQVL